MKPSRWVLGLFVVAIGCNAEAGGGNGTGALSPLGKGCNCRYDPDEMQIGCGDDFILWVPTPRRLNERRIVDVEIWDYPVSECGPTMGYAAAEVSMGTQRYNPSADEDLMFPVRPVYFRRIFAPEQSACQPGLPWCVEPECTEWPDSSADGFWVWCEGMLELDL